MSLRRSHAQFVVFDPSNYAEAVLQVAQLVRQYTWMLQQAQRLPVDMATRYRAVSPTGRLYDLDAGLRYAQPLLDALNVGDPSGTAYRQVVHPLDMPDDVLGAPAGRSSRGACDAYAAIELADSVAPIGVDQAGAMRVDGTQPASVVQAMQK